MRKCLDPLLVLILTVATAQAQKKDTSYVYLDSSMQLTQKSVAVCVEKIFKKDDLWQVAVQYKNNSSRIMTGSYKDKDLQIGEGLFEYYIRDTVVMRGYYHDGAQSGIWKKWATDGLVTDSVYFDAGTVISQAKFDYHENKHLWRFTLLTGNMKITKLYDTADVLISEGKFQGKDGDTFFYYPSGKLKTHASYRSGQRMVYDNFDENGNKIVSPDAGDAKKE